MCFLVCLHIHMVSTVALSICMSVIVSCLVPKVACWCTHDIAFHFHFLYVLISCVPSVWIPYCLCCPMQVRQFQCSCMCTWVHFMCMCAPLPPSQGWGTGTITPYTYLTITLYPLLLLGIDFHVGCLHVSIWLWCAVGLCLFHVSIRFAMYSFSSVLVMVPRECLQWYIVDWVIWTSYPWTQASIARCVTFASIAALCL